MVLLPNDTARWTTAITPGIMGLVFIPVTFSYMKWKMIVKGDLITLTRLFKGTQTFKIEDIKTAEQSQTCLFIHLENGERIHVMRVVGFDLLSTRLQEAGKFDYLQQQEKKSTVVRLCENRT